MNIPRNIQFTRLVKVEGRQREFNFRKRSEILYDTDTSDERGTRIVFKIVKHEDCWKLSGNDIPSNLRIHEKEIVQVVEKYEEGVG